MAAKRGGGIFSSSDVQLLLDAGSRDIRGLALLSNGTFSLTRNLGGRGGGGMYCVDFPTGPSSPCRRGMDGPW